MSTHLDHSLHVCISTRMAGAVAEGHLWAQMDLIPDAQAKQKLHQVIASLNASAEVHETEFCHLHLEHILGRGILHNPGANGVLQSPEGASCQQPGLKSIRHALRWPPIRGSGFDSSGGH